MTPAPRPPRMRWWWLSFSDYDRPRDKRLLGMAIVEAPGRLEADARARQLKIHRGGEVAYLELPEDPPKKWRDRPLAAAALPELEAWGKNVARARGRFELSKSGRKKDRRRRRREALSKPPAPRQL